MTTGPSWKRAGLRRPRRPAQVLGMASPARPAHQHCNHYKGTRCLAPHRAVPNSVTSDRGIFCSKGNVDVDVRPWHSLTAACVPSPRRSRRHKRCNAYFEAPSPSQREDSHLGGGGASTQEATCPLTQWPAVRGSFWCCQRYHKLYGLKQHKIYYLPEARSPNECREAG